jgi:biopolymer transport protein ExbB/TolQ
VVAASVALAGLIGVSPVQAGEVVNRERRQQERIGQGVQSGELTAKETQRLEKEQVKIEADRKQALADGKLTKRERAELHKEQDRASRHIYRQKHEAQKQPGAK